MSYLELQQVSKSYGDGAAQVHAIQDVNLCVDAGAPLSASQIDSARLAAWPRD